MKKLFTLTLLAVMSCIASYAVGPITGTKSMCAGSTTNLADTTIGGVWSSTITVVAVVGSTGTVYGISPGTSLISYTVSGVSSVVTVTVYPSPAAITGPSTVCKGSTITLSDATAGGSWMSGNTAVATAGSSNGVITGVSNGVVNIYYSISGCGAFKTVTVTGPSVITGPSSVCVGSTITLSDSTSGGTWSSGGTAASVTSGGVVTGLSFGAVNIYYSIGGCGAYHTVTVMPAPTSIGGPSSVCVGSSITLTDATSGGIWQSGNTAIATANPTSGGITGVSAGTVIITYKLTTGCFTLKTITVTTLTTPITGPSTVCIGSTITLSDATPGGNWQSGNTSIATTTSIGVVTGVSAGVVNIYYSVGGCGTSYSVTVTGGSTITGPSTVCVGGTITLVDTVSGGTWSTSGTAASVSSGGVVTGLASGVVNIYYLVGGCGAYHTVTVMPAPSSIGGPSTVCVGSSITLTDATTGGIWQSGNTTIATANPTSGSITGVSAGTVIITYKLTTGCFTLKTITVTTLTTPITGSSTVCIGSTISLTDATPGGTWLSGNTSIATVSSTGVVTGVTGGVVNIYYSVSGCGASKTITVTTGSVITGPSSVCVGGTITLVDTVSGGTWSSGGTAASVTSGGVVTGLASGIVNIYYSVGGCGAFHTITVMPAPSSIGGPSTVCVGSTITLTDAASGGSWSSSATSIATAGITSGVITGISAGTVTITYKLSSGCYVTKVITVTTLTTPISGSSTVCIGSNITLTDATPGGTWLSGNTSIATVSSAGIVTGVSAGVVNIYYSISGCGASKTVTVTGGSTITGPSTVCVGGTITLVDTISGGSWTAGGTALSVSSGGVVTGLAVGVANVYYIVGGCGAYHTVTVTTGPAAISGATSVCVGSATTYTDATSGGVWSSSNTAIATINVSTGVITGVSTGTATITYKLTSGCFVTKVITVTSLTTPITGGSTTCVGSTLTLSDATPGGTWLSGNTAIATVSSGGVVTGVAAGVVNIYYSISGCGASKTVTIVTAPKSITGLSTVCAGSTIALSDSTSGGTWLSSNTSIATVGSTGVVTGVAPGVVNIYYLVGTCGAYHTVTVIGSSVITGPSSVCVGSTITLSDATTGGTWLAGSTSVATVSSGGVVTGMSAGVVNIYYSVGGCGTYHTVTVMPSPKPISGLSTVCIGSTITLSDSTSGGSWLSGNTAIATVSSGGVVTGVSAGVVNIYYAFGSCGAYHTVTVIGSSTITGGSTLCVGASLTLSDATSGGTWSSSSSPIATVSSAGLVTAVSAGVVTISYTVGGCSATHAITVNPAPSSISGPSTVSVGGTITLTDAVSGGTWLCSSTSVATISSTGIVTGVATGVVNIYYILGSCAAYKTVTVTPAVPGHISGKITTGGAKGTTGELPVVGMNVELRDNMNNTITATATDAEGVYSFESLSDGSYIVYPGASGYTTIASAVVNISVSSETATGINFKQDNSSMTISPAPTAVAPVMYNTGISIFPNPANGYINIKWDGQTTGIANMSVTDVVGREVLSTVLNINDASGQAQVSLSGLKNGLYIVNIKSENINFSNKLMIQQ